MCESCSVWELQCLGVIVYGSCSVWELQCGGVAVWESHSVRELLCGGVAVWGSHTGEVAVRGSCGVEELQLWEGCCVGELQCGGAAVWGNCIMWGLQWLPSLNSLRFRRYSSFSCNPQKTNYFKNSPWLNRLSQLNLQ